MPEHDTSNMSEQAQTFLDQGKLAEAKALYEKICQLDNEDAEAWLMLGAIDGQTGLIDESLTSIQKAISLRPDYEEAHLTLANLLLAQGKLNDALASCNQAVQADPDYAEAWLMLGGIYGQLGQLDQVVSCNQKVAALWPDDADAYINLANAFYRQAKPKEAAENYQQALKINPEHSECHYNLGLCYIQQGLLDEAAECFRRAIKIKPFYSAAHHDLGHALLGRGKQKEAEACYRQALSSNQNFAEAYTSLGYLLSAQGKHEEALTNFQHTLKLKPGSTEASVGMAMMYERQGDFERTYELLRPLLGDDIVNINAALCYAAVAGHIDQRTESASLLESLLTKYPLKSAQIKLHYALGELYDELDRFDDAFPHYREANLLEAGRFNARQNAQFIDQLINTYGSENQVSRPRANKRSEQPVFIVGMPRSGTSLVEQILASHPQVHGAGELEDIDKIIRSLPGATGTNLPYPQCLDELAQEVTDTLAQHYLDRLTDLAPDTARVTDKMPHNFLALGLIDLLFPDARIIHCVRDPIDTCLSIYFHAMAGNHGYATDLENLGLYYKQYQRLMEHWKNTLRVPMLEIRYEELVDKQEQTSRAMVEFCGLEWEDSCLRFHETRRAVTTPSYRQVRRPIYRDSVERWRNYEKFMEPLITALD